MPKNVLNKLAQPPIARPLFRNCGDISLQWLAIIVLLGNVGIGVYAILAEQNATLYPYASIALSGFIVLWMLTLGEWALRYNVALACYANAVVLYTANWGLFWVAVMNFVEVPMAQEYVEEEWFQLQNTVLIPFTTLLDQKRLIYTLQLALLVLGIIGVVLNIAPLIEAWKAVGGTMRLVQTRFGVLIPEYIVLLILAGTAIAAGNYAATFSAWSTPYGTSALLWQSACAGLAILALGANFAAAAVWGVTFVTHALGVLSLAPLAFIVLVTSSVTINRASSIQAFVHDNWSDLRLFVPPEFSVRPPEKYAIACYQATTVAGAAGIILACLLVSVIITHVKCASILAAVGRQLTLLSAEREAAAARTAAGIPSQFTSSGEVANTSTEHASLLSPSGSSLYGATSGAGARPVDPSGFATLPLDDTTPPSSRSYMAQSLKLGELQVADYTEEMALEHQVQPLPVRAFFKDFAEDMKTAWTSFRGCILITLVVFVACVGGMAGALAAVGTLGQCSVLATPSQRTQVTYALWQEVEYYSDVTIGNDFDRGSIEIVYTANDKFSKGNFTVEVTYYAASSAALPSYDSFLSSVNITSPVVNDDDPAPAYMNVRLGFTPPDRTSKNCYTARLRIITSASYLSARITSRNALVNVTGDLPDVLDIINGNADGKIIKPVMSVLSVSTTDAPVVLQSVYADVLAAPPYFPNAKVNCDDPNHTVPPLVTVTSATGAIYVDNTVVPGGYFTTSGDIHTSTVASAFLLACQAVGGNLTLAATGGGRAAVSQGLAAANAVISTQRGVLSMANAGVLVANRLDITSETGKMFLANVIQASGNQTFISSGSDMALSAVFANYLDVRATGAAKVSAYVVYVGLTETPGLFRPSYAKNYTAPALVATTDYGTLTVIGFGGNPSNGSYANAASAILHSNLADVKLEVNGGGFNGNYTAASAHGNTFVEVVGALAGGSGSIGAGSKGFNVLDLYSDRGDVQLSFLASPL